MTEDEWVRSEDVAILTVAYRLGDRRVRLLAVAAVRALRWATGDVVESALAACERFADTGKSKAALNRAGRALLDARLAPGGAPADPVARAEAEATHLALFAAGCACAEGGVASTLREAARALHEAGGLSSGDARRALYSIFREVAGPIAPVAFAPEWRTDTAVSLARTMYESRDFSAMPILADALQDAGGNNEDVLSHCRGPGPHVRGCWVVDLVLGKEELGRG
jgi:hypothetical protein